MSSLKNPQSPNHFLGARFHELDGQYAGTIGWGTTSYNGQRSMILQKVNLKIIPYGRCTGKETGYDRFSHVEPLDHICAGYLGIGGKDTCEVKHQCFLFLIRIRISIIFSDF